MATTRRTYDPCTPAAAILLAGGSGQRLGRPEPKALVKVGGVTLVVRAARMLAESGEVDLIVVVTETTHHQQFVDLLAAEDLRVGGIADGTPVAVVLTTGGPSRQASVDRGLAALSEAGSSAQIVVVHEAARALAPADLTYRMVAGLREGHTCVTPAIPLHETLKSVKRVDDGAPVMTGTLPREPWRVVQNPTAFHRATLERAHREYLHIAQDEATSVLDSTVLLEWIGAEVRVVEGDALALKVTVPMDLIVCEELVRRMDAASMEGDLAAV